LAEEITPSVVQIKMIDTILPNIRPLPPLIETS